MKGIIPREECNRYSLKVRCVLHGNFRVNRPVCFIITDFAVDETENAFCSSFKRKTAALYEKYISHLVCGIVIDARITLENFGAFADIGCGIVALMPIDTISVSRIEHPRERFTVGMDIRAVIKSIRNDRISLSHKELLGTWEENANSFCAGETSIFCGNCTQCRKLRCVCRTCP